MLVKKRVLLCVMGFLVAFFAMEVYYRLFRYSSDPLPHAVEGFQKQYRSSSLLGFEPISGENSRYNAYGVLKCNYPLSKGEGIYRILWLGDSVSARRLYVNQLEKKLNATPALGHRFEIWNAAVEGYDTLQQQRFLIHKGLSYKPDRVILQFHLNDFSGTPVLFNDQGKFAYFIPATMQSYPIHPWLMLHSHFYRHLVWRAVQLFQNSKHYRLKRYREIEKALVSINERLEKEEIPWLIVIFPLFKPLEEYDAEEKKSYETIQGIVAKYDLRALDLTPTFHQATDPVTFQQETGDHWHLNKKGHALASEVIYQYLVTHLHFE